MLLVRMRMRFGSVMRYRGTPHQVRWKEMRRYWNGYGRNAIKVGLACSDCQQAVVRLSIFRNQRRITAHTRLGTCSFVLRVRRTPPPTNILYTYPNPFVPRWTIVP